MDLQNRTVRTINFDEYEINLNLKQMYLRDTHIYEFLKHLNIPGAYVMAGGYGEAVYKVYSGFLHFVLSDYIKSLK